jgi:hypothetical protein
MAQADSQSTTCRTFLGSPETQLTANTVISPAVVPAPNPAAVSDPKASDLIFAAIDTHRRELDRRNRTIEAICAAEDRHKAEERDAWHRYEKASIALLTTKPATIGGVIALMNYVALRDAHYSLRAKRAGRRGHQRRLPKPLM